MSKWWNVMQGVRHRVEIIASLLPEFLLVFAITLKQSAADNSRKTYWMHYFLDKDLSLAFSFYHCTIFAPFFISVFHSLFHLSPTWIIAILTCLVQSTQTYFLWCLPAAWLSLAHSSSAMAPVFLLTTAYSSRVRWNQLVPSLIQASWVTWAACSPLPYILLFPAARWLFLPGLEGPGRGQSGLVHKWEPYCGYLLFHLSPPFALESREATDILQSLRDSSQGDHVNYWTPKQGWVCVSFYILYEWVCLWEHTEFSVKGPLKSLATMSLCDMINSEESTRASGHTQTHRNTWPQWHNLEERCGVLFK